MMHYIFSFKIQWFLVLYATESSTKSAPIFMPIKNDPQYVQLSFTYVLLQVLSLELLVSLGSWMDVFLEYKYIGIACLSHNIIA